MFYEVFGKYGDTTIPCILIHKGRKEQMFGSNKFRSLEDAISYARRWLGNYSERLPNDWEGEIVCFYLNLQGKKCFIEIREINPLRKKYARQTV